MDFTTYFAIGDALSLDLYPALDVGATDVAVALERVPTVGVVAPIGAASLLHENDDERWPEFAGRDLATHVPGIRYVNLAEDGATIGDVFGDQLPEVPRTDDPVLVTITLGGNDLLSALSRLPSARVLDRIVHDIGGAYEFLLGELHRLAPRALIVLSTVYDPSDGTGVVPGVLDGAGHLPLEPLDALNARIRELARRRPNVRLADVHAHFLGHGVSAPEGERWYWRRSPIEPSAIGASEIRRVWLQALDLN